MESCSGSGCSLPLPEILVTSAPIGEVRRQHSPLAAAFRRYRHAAENVIQVHDAVAWSGVEPTPAWAEYGRIAPY